MLDELQTRIADKNVLLLGVGNRQREDDGVGSYLVRRLQRKIRIPSLDAGDVPENYIKQIENSGADFLLIVDAADFGANPGYYSEKQATGSAPRGDPAWGYRTRQKVVGTGS